MTRGQLEGAHGCAFQLADSDLAPVIWTWRRVDMEAGATRTPTTRLEIGVDSWTGFALGASTATSYRAGNTFTADSIIGWKPLKHVPSLQLGLQGDVSRQFSDDTLNGLRVGATHQNALGPLVRWNFGPGKGIVDKYQRGFDVVNRPEGNRS